MPATINLDDIDPQQRKQLGIKKPRETAFSKDDLRGWSLKVLALMASLSRAERERVHGTPAAKGRNGRKTATV